MQHPDLSSEAGRFDPSRIYLREGMIADDEDLLMEFSGWIDFIQDEAGVAADLLPPAALGLHHAYRYHGAAYNDGHALYFHNLKRNDALEATLPAIRAGLALLPAAEYRDNFIAAEAALATHRQLWDVPRFGPYSAEYAAARAVMEQADARYAALLDGDHLEALILEQVRALPELAVVPDQVYRTVREVALRNAPGRSAAAEAVAKMEDDRRAAILRDLDAFAADHLGRIAGYVELIDLGPGLHAFPGRDAQTFMAGLRTQARGIQQTHLLRAEGKYALMDFAMDEVLAAARISEVEAFRQAKLRVAAGSPPPAPPAPPRAPGLRPSGWFGRKR